MGESVPPSSWIKMLHQPVESLVQGTASTPHREGLLGGPAGYEETPQKTTSIPSDTVRPGHNVRAAGQGLWATSDRRAASFLGKCPQTPVHGRSQVEPVPAKRPGQKNN